MSHGERSHFNQPCLVRPVEERRKTEMEGEHGEIRKKKRQTDEREQSGTNLYADETWKPDLQTYME